MRLAAMCGLGLMLAGCGSHGSGPADESHDAGSSPSGKEDAGSKQMATASGAGQSFGSTAPDAATVDNWDAQNPAQDAANSNYTFVPCERDAGRAGAAVDKLDLLLALDDAASVRAHADALRAALPALLASLTSGEHAFTDVHLGVVSGNLGAVDINGISGCDGLGEDGVLQHTPDPDASDCQASYPAFLSFDPVHNDAASVAHDLSCIATLTDQGCGVRQPFEAALKALWPSADNRVLFLGDHNGFGTLGRGDEENAGFLRGDPASVLAVLVLSDNDDCSFSNPTFLADAGGAGADPDALCREHPEDLYVIERYVNALHALRPDLEHLAVFGAIAGIPTDRVGPDQLDFDWSDGDARAQFYADLLADKRMNGEGPSCSSDRGDAFASRRAVEVASKFGDAGFIASICDADFAPALERFADTVKLAGTRGTACFSQSP